MRLLLVEDEPGIAKFLKDGLEEEYFTVDVAENGEDGLQMALNTEYDLLLVDWILPKMNGTELVRTYRKTNLETPIFFLTARDTTQDVVYGLDSGATDYIKKPFEFEELLARIRAHLRKSLLVFPKINFAGIELNSENHQVWFNGKEIVLTQKEFGLLEYLLQNINRICTRAGIIEHVWDIHFDANTSVIDVYINFLRKKLRLAGAPEIIHTVRGVGYIIRDNK